MGFTFQRAAPSQPKLFAYSPPSAPFLEGLTSTAAGFQAAIIFAIVGGLIGGVVVRLYRDHDGSTSSIKSRVFNTL
jgi:hypothetical protein